MLLWHAILKCPVTYSGILRRARDELSGSTYATGRPEILIGDADPGLLLR